MRWLHCGTDLLSYYLVHSITLHQLTDGPLAVCLLILNSWYTRRGDLARGILTSRLQVLISEMAQTRVKVSH